MDVSKYGSLLTDGIGFEREALFIVWQVSRVKRIESDCKGRYVFHANILNIDIFNHAAATSSALKTKSYVGTEKITISDKDISNAAAHLTSDSESAVPVIYGAIPNHYIFRWYVSPASIFVFSRFYADRIVANIKGAVVDNNIFTRFQIKAIFPKYGLEIGAWTAISAGAIYLFDIILLTRRGWREAANEELSTTNLH